VARAEPIKDALSRASMAASSQERVKKDDFFFTGVTEKDAPFTAVESWEELLQLGVMPSFA